MTKFFTTFLTACAFMFAGASSVEAGFGSAFKSKVGGQLGRAISDSAVLKGAASSNMCTRFSRTCTKKNCRANELAYRACAGFCPGKHTACESAGESEFEGKEHMKQFQRLLAQKTKARKIFCDKVEDISGNHKHLFNDLAKMSAQLRCTK